MFCLWWVPVVKYFSIEYGLYRLLASPRHMTAGWIERLKDENDSVLSTTSPMPNAYNYNCILKPEIMYATQSPYEQNDQVMASSAFVQISEESTAVNPDELGNSKYWDEMAMMLRYLTARSNQER